MLRLIFYHSKNMKMFFVGMMVAVFVLTSLDTPIQASEKEENNKKWEIGLSFSLNPATKETEYIHNYSPPLTNSSFDPVESTSIQQLVVKPENSIGVNGIVNYLFNKKIGIQFLFNYKKANITGTGNGYKTHLIYLAVPPPYDKIVQYTQNREYPLPDTTGYINQSTFALNLLTRFHLTPTVSIDLSGGPGIFIAKGEMEPIAYTLHTFAHFILVDLPYRLKVSLKSKANLGLNLGGTINILITKNLAIYTSCRYFLCPELSSEVEVKEISNTGGGLSNTPLNEITPYLNLQPLELKLSTLVLNMGIKLVF